LQTRVFGDSAEMPVPGQLLGFQLMDAAADVNMDLTDSRIFRGGIQQVADGYRAVINSGGKTTDLGTFPTFDEAGRLYDEARKRDPLAGR
jgi:hypothetical protein